MAVTNKQKQLADEVEHLKFQLEEEEDSKQQIQNRLIQLTQQVTPSTSGNNCQLTTHHF